MPVGVGDGQDESVTETNSARVYEMTEAAGAVEEEELSSFTPRSPISVPCIPDELTDPTAYPAAVAAPALEEAEAKAKAKAKYKAKLGRRYDLVTLLPKTSSSFRPDLRIRESAKKAVLCAAKYTIRLSSSVDGTPLAMCCGLWIKWDPERKTGIVLTTAHLIRSKHPTGDLWEGRDEYNTKANVFVHLLDGTTAEGHYLYHQEHYDLAFFMVGVDDKPDEFPSFSESVHCGQDVFRLGRDDHMNLRITQGRVDDRNPRSFERHHCMYFFHQQNGDNFYHRKDDDYLCDDDGGSIIGFDGKFVGLVNKHLEMTFVPSCILRKGVDLWCKFGCIPRLHLGMKFASIKLLDPLHIEKIWRMHKIEDGLIVQEVSQESRAEKLGICTGDVIELFNGECISTTVELENMLLVRCRDHLDQGNELNEQIYVSIQVFHMKERLRRNINLIVDVSDGGEVVKRRTYPITAIEGTSRKRRSTGGTKKMASSAAKMELLAEPLQRNTRDGTSRKWRSTGGPAASRKWRSTGGPKKMASSAAKLEFLAEPLQRNTRDGRFR